MPFIKFYTRDWQADPELRMCSLEARGLWLEMLCIMHTAKRRGFLETPNGSPLDDDQTSRLIGAFKDDLYRCKAELLLHSIPSVEEETGVWYCRRMVKETAKSQKCSQAGRSGGGNPLLKSKEEDQIPDTRHHISLNGTFKGADDQQRLLSIYPEYEQIQKSKVLKKITLERYARIASDFPNVNRAGVVKLACLKADDPDAKISKPDPWLVAQFKHAPDKPKHSPLIIIEEMP